MCVCDGGAVCMDSSPYRNCTLALCSALEALSERFLDREKEEPERVSASRRRGETGSFACVMSEVERILDSSPTGNCILALWQAG